MARALGRAFAAAQAALPAALAVGQGVVLKSPQLINPAQVDARDADQVLQRVRRAIEAAAHVRSLPLSLPAPAERQRGQPIRAAFERFDDARVDIDSGAYDIPSYDGRRVAAPIEHRRSKRRWRVERRAKLRLSLDSFLDWRGSLAPDKPDAGDKTAYLDFLSTVREANAWLVVADAVWDADDLADEVTEYFFEQAPSEQQYTYGYTVYEESRQALANRVGGGHPLEAWPAAVRPSPAQCQLGHAWRRNDVRGYAIARHVAPRADHARRPAFSNDEGPGARLPRRGEDVRCQLPRHPVGRTSSPSSAIGRPWSPSSRST